MKELINLYEIEFKKNYRVYIVGITIMTLVLIFNLVSNLNDYNYVIENTLRSDNIATIIGSTIFENVLTSNIKDVFIIGILSCVFYTVIIWSVDFIGANKSIYTLLMLPQNRMYIFISKVMNIMTFIYMYMISYISTLYIANLIIPKLMSTEVIDNGFVQNTIYTVGSIFPYNLNEFFLIYVMLLLAAVSLLSVVCMSILLKDKKIKVIKIILYAIISVSFYIGFIILSITKKPTISISIYSVVVIMISIIRAKYIFKKINI